MPEVPGAHCAYVWRPALPAVFLDYRLEVPEGLGRVTVVCYLAHPDNVQFYLPARVQPDAEALRKRYELQAVGLFDGQILLRSAGGDILTDNPMTQRWFLADHRNEIL